MKDVSVGMLYPTRGHRGTSKSVTEYGHPAHRGFARRIGAQDVRLSTADLLPTSANTVVADLLAATISEIPPCDVFVTENDSALYAAPRLSYQYPDATIIHLAAADRLLGWDSPLSSTDVSEYALHRRTVKQIDESLLRRFLAENCDGIIAVSELVADCLAQFVSERLPIRVVNPYIQPDVFQSLESADPDVSADVAVTVGQARGHKGVDMLVDAWPEVRNHQPGAELWVVGPGHPAQYAETVGVTVWGRVDSLASVLSRASVYVHPAYLEPFGVSVVEAMCAGVPPIVTTTTGAKSAVQSIDPELVVDPTPTDLRRAIVSYFESGESSRQGLSEAARRVSRSYTEARQTRRFEQQFDSLLEEIRPAPAVGTSG